ncbi:MAG: phosphatidate cytidylyltransferase [archaeon]
MLKEIKRQFIHLALGSCFIFLVPILSVTQLFFLVLLLLGIGLIFSFMIKKRILIPFFSYLVETVERKHERFIPGQGSFMFFLGLIVLLLVFQNQLIVLGALIVVVFGDSVATIVGLTIGKHRLLNNRTLEGSVAGIVAAFIFLSILFPPNIAFLVAFTGMLAEFLPVNDNLSIPIVSGMVLKLLLI